MIVSFSRCLFEFCTSTSILALLPWPLCTNLIRISFNHRTPHSTPNTIRFPHRIYNYITFNSCHLRTETQSSVLFYFPFVGWVFSLSLQIRCRFFDIAVVDVVVIVVASKWHVIKWTRLILFLFFSVIFYRIFGFLLFFVYLFCPRSKWVCVFCACAHSLHKHSYLIESIRSS